MRSLRRVLASALPMVLMVVLSSCGGNSPAASGVSGMVVSNPGGRIIGSYPSPTPLPDGFGLGEMSIGSGSAIVKLVVEPYPWGATVLVRATGGPEAGKLVSRVNLEAGRDIFSATLVPGTYFIFAQGCSSLGTTVVVRAGHYTRVLVLAGLRH